MCTDVVLRRCYSDCHTFLLFTDQVTATSHTVTGLVGDGYWIVGREFTCNFKFSMLRFC